MLLHQEHAENVLSYIFTLPSLSNLMQSNTSLQMQKDAIISTLPLHRL